MFLAMFTHTLIDALTTWGTQIFWPFDTRIAIKSVFVIDPLYTLPFMIFLIISMFKRKDDDKRRKYNKLGLMISSGYLVFGLFMKTFINQQFTSSLERQGIQYEAIETRPTPLNTIMWSANIKTKNGFITGDYSIFDTQPEIEFSDELKKQDYLIESFKEENKIQILKRMTKGWYVIEQQGDKLIFNDLRFGRIGMSDKNAQFAFSYELFYDENGVFQAMERPKSMDSGKEAFKDLFDRIGGN
jgi:inner membrane protein